MLVLGTVQLGIPYGIANSTGQPSQKVATSIIAEAWKNGICEFDTAQGYGISESVLGIAFSELGINTKVRVISKFNPQIDHLDQDAMLNAIEASIERLRISKLYGIMLHREELLSLWNKGLFEVLKKFVLTNKAERIGISVYTPEIAIEALQTDGIDMIQIPANIFDRRFENAGVFQLAEKKKKEVFIRSVFLQGLLLMDISMIPKKMSFAIPYIEKVDKLSKELRLTRHEIAFGYIKSAIPSAKIVFGAETKEQVIENLSAWQKDVSAFLSEKVKAIFPNVDEKLLNPSLW
ncbi:MAG: aldo/keto reductase [Desulfobacterales bacterium]|nr:aldo/keto reductase [Desulfobacterales bacterium]